MGVERPGGTDGQGLRGASETLQLQSRFTSLRGLAKSKTPSCQLILLMSENELGQFPHHVQICQPDWCLHKTSHLCQQQLSTITAGKLGCSLTKMTGGCHPIFDQEDRAPVARQHASFLAADRDRVSRSTLETHTCPCTKNIKEQYLSPSVTYETLLTFLIRGTIRLRSRIIEPRVNRQLWQWRLAVIEFNMIFYVRKGNKGSLLIWGGSHKRLASVLFCSACENPLRFSFALRLLSRKYFKESSNELPIIAKLLLFGDAARIVRCYFSLSALLILS